MTQLFDTENYEEAHALQSGDNRPRLRSIPAGIQHDDGDLELANRTTQWRLDDQTIEIGRRGIVAAREALRDAAKANEQQERKAA